MCVVRSLLPASEKRVAAHEERVGRFAKKSSCEGVMPAIPKCYMVKELASRATHQGWVADRLAILPEHEIGHPVAPLRSEGDARVASAHCDGVGQRNDGSRRQIRT